MSKADHTPTPWMILEDGFHEEQLEITSADRAQNDMSEIAVVDVGFGGEFQAEQHANAAFIVRAVNAHDALVAALKDALRRSRDMHFKSGPDGDRQHREAYADHYAALALAEAGEAPQTGLTDEPTFGTDALIQQVMEKKGEQS